MFFSLHVLIDNLLYNLSNVTERLPCCYNSLVLLPSLTPDAFTGLMSLKLKKETSDQQLALRRGFPAGRSECTSSTSICTGCQRCYTNTHTPIHNIRFNISGGRIPTKEIIVDKSSSTKIWPLARAPIAPSSCSQNSTLIVELSSLINSLSRSGQMRGEG